MTDEAIVALYWARDEAAVAASRAQYGRLCGAIAGRLLQNPQDAEECVSDTWLAAWNAMPDARPARLGPFLGRITRNLALKRLERDGAQKRTAEFGRTLDELAECLPGGGSVEQALDAKALAGAVNEYLRGLKPFVRTAFLQRYWYARPVKEIAAACGVSENKVSVTLHRARAGLRRFLQEKEGWL